MLTAPSRTANGERIVNKHHSVADKTIIANFDHFANKCMRLNPSSRANRHIFLNFDKGPNKAIAANRAAIEVCRLNYCDSVPERDIDDPRFSNDGRTHYLPPSRLCRGLKRKCTSRCDSIDS